MHYHELQSDQDKIIHLLCAAIQDGLYGKAIIECVHTFGEEVTQDAIQLFKTEYKTTYDRYR